MNTHDAHELDHLSRGRDLTDAEIACYLADHQTALRHGTARVGDEIAEHLRDRLRDVNEAATQPKTRNLEHREPYFALGTAMQDSFASRDAERHLRGVAETWASLRRQGYTVAAFDDLGETGTEHWNVPCSHGMAAHNDTGCIDCECTTPGFRPSVAPRLMTHLDPDPRHVPEDEPRPVLRPARPWGCVVAILVWLAFWAIVITLVIHIVTP